MMARPRACPAACDALDRGMIDASCRQQGHQLLDFLEGGDGGTPLAARFRGGPARPTPYSVSGWPPIAPALLTRAGGLPTGGSGPTSTLASRGGPVVALTHARGRSPRAYSP